ncbi:hypothetical protein MRX96_030410 [Rhipicephalus microplus]
MARPVGDFLIYCPTLFFLEEAARVGGRVFFYELAYNPSYRTWPAWQGVPQFVDLVLATGLIAQLDASATGHGNRPGLFKDDRWICQERVHF